VSATLEQPRDRVQLALEGMTCASCATRIERKLNKLEGVEATVNFATEQAAVSYDPARTAVDDLIRAVEAARAGEFYVDPGLSSAIVLDEAERTLSARQAQILQMLADGMQTDAVAERLGLSTETVRTHTKRILAKLEASTRTQAVAIGIRHGMID
jgi:DNA-binding NarL/FixJ family response regulator